MADRTWWQRALTRLGVRVHRIEELAPKFDKDAAAAGRYIFVHNDSVSTMNAVTEWLKRSFDLDARDAAVVMIGIHLHGFGAIGPFEPREADRRMELARRAAADLGLDELVFSREPPARAPRAATPG